MTIKIGMLGAARIGREGLVRPARKVEGIELYAVAARDGDRARAYANQHGIAVSFPSYQAMLDNPSIDAIYNPLPNALHCEWSIRALEAGKHVLCEKPLAANAEEVRRMAAVAASHDLVLMEALHYRFHPLAVRMQEAVAQLGRIRHIETTMCIPFPVFNNIRYDYELAGGATMDLGVYTISLLRFLAAAASEPAMHEEPSIESVRAKIRGKNIDRAMKVDLRWPTGATGRLHYSLWSATLLKLSARVIGEHGELRVRNPYVPQLRNRVELRLNDSKQTETVSGETSYTCQLREFLRRINGESPGGSVDLPDSIATITLIEAIYDRAGMPRRGL